MYNSSKHNPLRVTYMFLLMASMVFFQACDSDEDRSTTGFNGVVTSSGKPVADAAISLAGDNGQYSALAGSDGKFRISDVVSGDYRLTVKSEEENGKFVEYQKEVSVSSSSESQNIELPEGVTLFQPANITASTVELKWTKSVIEDFLEYKLYRHSTSGLDETTGTLVHVATSDADTVFTDTQLQDSETYYYRVFVRNTLGLYGGSNIVEVTTGQGNYIVNPDFEQDLTGWELFTPNPCVSIAQDPTSPAGSKVLKAEMNTIDLVNISSEILQEINQQNLVSGNTYTLSFFAKKQSLTGNGKLRFALVRSNDWTHHWVSIEVSASASTDWTKYEADFIAPAAIAPYTLHIFASPDVPWSQSEDLFNVLVDGFSLHRKIE